MSGGEGRGACYRGGQTAPLLSCLLSAVPPAAVSAPRTSRHPHREPFWPVRQQLLYFHTIYKKAAARQGQMFGRAKSAAQQSAIKNRSIKTTTDKSKDILIIVFNLFVAAFSSGALGTPALEMYVGRYNVLYTRMAHTPFVNRMHCVQCVYLILHVSYVYSVKQGD